MTLLKNVNVEPEIFNRTQCDMNFACLSDAGVCNAELYLDRDVEVLRCREERACRYRRKYLDLHICTCPVNRAAFNLN